MFFCLGDKNYMYIVRLDKKLLLKIGQILCAHKTGFLMPGHNFNAINSVPT